MSQRAIKTSLWGDPFIESLTPHKKLLYLYLLTNEGTQLSGLHQRTVRKMAQETGLAEEEVREILVEFEAAGRIVYDDSLVFVVNFVKHQNAMKFGQLHAHVRKVDGDLKKPGNRAYVAFAAAFADILAGRPTKGVEQSEQVGAVIIPMKQAGEGSENPSQRVEEPFSNPSVTLREGLHKEERKEESVYSLSVEGECEGETRPVAERSASGRSAAVLPATDQSASTDPYADERPPMPNGVVAGMWTDFYDAYPRGIHARLDNHHAKKAFVRASMGDPAQAAQIIDGVKWYAAYIRATNTESRFVMSAQKFIEEKNYNLPYDIPPELMAKAQAAQWEPGMPYNKAYFQATGMRILPGVDPRSIRPSTKH